MYTWLHVHVCVHTYTHMYTHNYYTNNNSKGTNELNTLSPSSSTIFNVLFPLPGNEK